MKFSVAVILLVALVATTRAGNFLRGFDEEVELSDPVTRNIVLRFDPEIRVAGVNGTDPVTVNRVIDDVDIMVTRERRINEEDNMRPSIRSLDDIGIPVTRVVDLSDLAPTPPIYTTPPITDTPPATTTTPTTETTEPPVMTPYDRRDYLLYAA